MADRLPPMQDLKDLDPSQPIPALQRPQLEALTALETARQHDIKSGYMHLVTGMGKTAVQMGDFLRFREEASTLGHAAPRGLRVAPRSWGYAEQMARHFAPDLTVQFYKPDLTSVSTDLVVSGLAALAKRRESLDPATFEYIIYDDVSRDRLEEYAALVSHFKPKFQVGYTVDSTVRAEQLQPIFGDQLYTIGNVLETTLPPVAHSIEVGEAIARGLIGPHEYKPQ